MKSIGSFLVILGLAAIVFDFMDRVPTILSWMYDYGNTTAWVIKIGLVVVGAALYLMGARQKKEEAKEESAGS